MLAYKLPDGLSKLQIESSLGDNLHLVYAMTTTWESIGVLVCRGEISIDMVDEFDQTYRALGPGSRAR